jgi:3-hydroxyacyl-CoA dehydrogenase/3a,7a,12a-trihydroxy-5b-cholest-24-enoyl-CoA hydratase
MTATVMPEDVLKVLSSEYVAPFVAFMAHESFPDNGGLYEVAAGCIARQRWQRSAGVQYDTFNLSPELIASQWAKVGDFSAGATNPESNQEFLEVVMNHMEKLKSKKEEAPSAPAAKQGSGLKSEGIFNMMKVFLARGEGKPLIPKVNAAFGFEILAKKGDKTPALIYEIDLKNGQGDVNQRKPEKADATFTMTDDDFHAVCMGKLSPQIAFMKGQMKIKGNMAAAGKFTPDLFPQPTPENMAKYAGAKM